VAMVAAVAAVGTTDDNDNRSRGWVESMETN